MSLCSSAEVGNTRSFPFSKRPSSGVSQNFPIWSRSSVALLCASITMGAMRFPLRPTVVKPSSFSLLASDGFRRRAAWRDHRLRRLYCADLSSADVSPCSIEDSAPPIWRGEVDVGGSLRSDFACFFDGVCLLGDAGWRLASFRFVCEADVAAVGTRLSRSMSLM
ncbi:hypothetical protein TNCV_2688081 [Trichonephila clavipes]|nr:hypothetical protein TNCV_2688081 [Trichonephila clavipes]